MQIDRLALRNFRQHADTVLELGPGLVGITGANGAGKSTLLEAIIFALYGVQAARGNKETLRRRGAPPRSRTEVELAFTLGGRGYRVVRAVTTAELYQQGSDAPLASSQAAVTEQVEKLLGMSRQEFLNTYFTGQKELAVMASMGPAERGRFLSSVLGYEKLEEARGRNKERRKAVETRLQVLRDGRPDAEQLAAEREASLAAREQARATVAHAEQRAASATALLAELRPRLEAMASQRDQHERLERERRAAAAVVPDRQQALDRAAQALAAAVAAEQQLTALRPQLEPLDAVRAEVERYAIAASSARDRAALVQSHAQDAERLAQMDRELLTLPDETLLPELVERGKALRAALDEADGRAKELRKVWTQDLQDAQTQRQALLNQYEDFKEQYDRLRDAGDDGLCPTCRRPLEARREEVLAELADKLEEVKQNGTYMARRVEQLKAEPADLQDADRRHAELQHEVDEARKRYADAQHEVKRAAQLRAERPGLAARVAELAERLAAAPATYEPEAHAEARRRLAALEELARRVDRLGADAARKAAAETEQASAAARLAEAVEHEQACARALAALGFDAAAAAALEAEHAAAVDVERDAAIAVAKARGDVDAAERSVQAVEARQAELAATEARIAEAERELLMRQELDRAFTDLRTDLNARLRPELAELASGFLQDLTQGRYTDLELDEQYQATVLDEGEPKPVISGGEDDVVNLALRLAISQMIAERAGQPLSFLVLDEIFGSLDEHRRGAVLELLRSLADRFPQVLLVTHVDQLRDSVDRLLRVEYDAVARTSRVREERPEVPDVAA